MRDILQTVEMDLALTNAGDISYTESTLQHQRDLLLAHKGECRLNPVVGVGITDFLEDEGPELLTREIYGQFTQDGMTVKSIDDKLNIVAGY
jgi:hypothetical protein